MPTDSRGEDREPATALAARPRVLLVPLMYSSACPQDQRSTMNSLQLLLSETTPDRMANDAVSLVKRYATVILASVTADPHLGHWLRHDQTWRTLAHHMSVPSWFGRIHPVNPLAFALLHTYEWQAATEGSIRDTLEHTMWDAHTALRVAWTIARRSRYIHITHPLVRLVDKRKLQLLLLMFDLLYIEYIRRATCHQRNRYSSYAPAVASAIVCD